MRCARYDWLHGPSHRRGDQLLRAMTKIVARSLGIFTALTGRFQALAAVRLLPYRALYRWVEIEALERVF
jgi:hypothetical protein